MQLARVRLRLALDTRLSLHAFLQYDSVSDVASVNARFRFAIRDGSDLWVVYNEAMNTHRYAQVPIPPTSRGRAVMVKYTHTLAW